MQGDVDFDPNTPYPELEDDDFASIVPRPELEKRGYHKLKYAQLVDLDDAEALLHISTLSVSNQSYSLAYSKKSAKLGHPVALAIVCECEELMLECAARGHVIGNTTACTTN